MYLYVKDPYEAKCQLFINKWKSLGLKRCKDRKDSVEYFNDMDNIHEFIDEYNPSKKRK